MLNEHDISIIFRPTCAKIKDLHRLQGHHYYANFLKINAFPYSYAWTVIPDASTKYDTSTLIITLSTDRTETETLLTNSSAPFVLTQRHPDNWRQLAS